MSEIIDSLKIAFGINPQKVRTEIIDAYEIPVNQTRYLVFDIKFINLSNSVVELNSNVGTNMNGSIRHVNVTIPINYNPQGNLIDFSKEFSTTITTVINSKEKGIVKSLIFGTSWNSDIELIFTDSNGVNTKCTCPFSKIKIHTQPKSGWVKGII